MFFNLFCVTLFSLAQLGNASNDNEFEVKLPPTSNIINALIELNAQYTIQEATAPMEGYCVVFEEHPKFQANLIPMGKLRKTAKLSGVPENTDLYQLHKCPFCSNNLTIFRDYDDHYLAIISRSKQILLIPEKHYTHWFEVPLEEQTQLIEYALELRQLYSFLIQAPLELHCGSAAFQTVFHVHLRTGIILPKDRVGFF